MMVKITGWIFCIFFCLACEINAQAPLIFDEKNAPHIIELKAYEPTNLQGSAFSAVEHGQDILWVAYEQKATSGRLVLSDESIYRIMSREKGAADGSSKELKLLSGKDRQYGPVSFAEEIEFLFFTASQDRPYRAQTQLGLYRISSDLSGGVEVLPFVKREYNYAHPSWDGLNNRLYFSSDMESTRGNMDLFRVEWLNGRWSRPEKIENGLSSNGNDLFPFVHPRGLFFSSDRRGELELYLAEREGETYAPPVPLAAPFNSQAADFAIWFSEDETYGYLSSNRGKTGRDKVYRFQCPGSCFLPASVSKSVEVVVRSARDQSLVPNTDIYLVPVEKLTALFTEGELDWDPLSNKLSLDLLNRLEGSRSVWKSVTNREGKSLITAPTNEQDFLLILVAEGHQSKLMQIEFEEGFSHLDRRVVLDSDCRPLFLSVVDEEGTRIDSVGVVIRSGDEEIYNGVTEEGLSICLKLNRQFAIRTFADSRRDGDTFYFTENNQMDSLKIVMESEKIEEVREGTVLELENIYYEYNSHLISADAMSELDELARIMKMDREMMIELRAHTDSRGRSDYNLQLSQRRANSAMEYLVTTGVEANRIRTLGLGETQLRNHCESGVECSEEEHAYNRRTEVVVLRAGEGVRAVRENGGLRFTIYEE